MGKTAQDEIDPAIADLQALNRLKPDRPEFTITSVTPTSAGGWTRRSPSIAPLRLKSDGPEFHGNLAIALSDKGKLEEAIAEYRAALNLKPDFSNAHFGLGTTLRKQGKSDEAMVEYNTAIGLEPGRVEFHFNLGNALIDRGKLDQAIAAYQTAIRFKPGYAEAHSNLGVALFASERSTRRSPSTAKPSASNQTMPRPTPTSAPLFGSRGSLPTPSRKYVKPSVSSPNMPAHPNLGNALDDSGRPSEAIAEYREAIRLKPDSPTSHSNLGNALQRTGNLTEAIAEYRAALRLKSDYPEAHSNLGNALQRTGNLTEAIAEYREAIRLKKDFAEAHCNLRAALQAQNRITEAVAELGEAIRLKPDYPQARAWLGFALHTQGELAQAIAELRKAREMAKADPGLILKIEAELAVAEGQADMAARIPALLHGEDQPKNAAELLEFGFLSYTLKPYWGRPDDDESVPG